MELVTTPAAANANSYASVEEADSYHEGHLYASGWESASDTIKTAALVMAARLMDRWPRAWTGNASTETQAMGWPRLDMLTRNGFPIASGEIPIDLKNAQAEFARQLISEDRTEDAAVILQGITRLKAGPVELEFKASNYDRVALSRRESLEAVVPDAVVALLVPTWLKDPRDEDLQYVGLVFESV